jgi:hypothetical protein
LQTLASVLHGAQKNNTMRWKVDLLAIDMSRNWGDTKEDELNNVPRLLLLYAG